MIAMVVGLVLLAGVLSVFISSRSGYGANTAAAQVQEYGRFALDFMRGNVRMTSYMGCTTTARSNTILNPVGQLYNFMLPVYGYEYNGTDPATATSGAPYVIASQAPAGTTLTSGSWTPAGDSTTNTSTGPGVAISNAVPGSDALVLLSATGEPVYLTAPSAGGSLSVTTSTTLAAGQVAIISDCLKSTAFQVGSSDNNTPGILTLGSSSPGPGNYQNTFSVGYQSGAQVLPASVMVYYVGQDTNGDNSPALFQAQLQPNGSFANPPQVIVPGVENMQVLYGVNTAGGSSATSPNQYLTAAQVDATNNWANVLSVQLGLLVRSSTAAVPLPATAQTFNILNTYVKAPLDTRLRHVFTATIYLRNAPLPTS
ncbi:MAG: PilW family protein [Gammaproteobacteria bacterium]|nr:PilW family protein [Gammaproteobacteria bacterium]